MRRGGSSLLFFLLNPAVPVAVLSGRSSFPPPNPPPVRKVMEEKDGEMGEKRQPPPEAPPCLLRIQTLRHEHHWLPSQLWAEGKRGGGGLCEGGKLSFKTSKVEANFQRFGNRDGTKRDCNTLQTGWGKEREGERLDPFGKFL